MQESIRYRSEIGLNDDPKYIQNLIHSYKNGNDKFNFKFGVILSEEEFLKIDNRFKSQNEYIPKVKEYIAKNLNNKKFASMYIDQKNGGTLNIGFKEQLTRTETAQLKNLYYNKNIINIYQTDVSDTDLMEYQDYISSKKDTIKDMGIGLQSVRIDLENNKIVIGVHPYKQSDVDLIMGMFDEQLISVKEVQPIYVEHHTRPVQAGTRITGPRGNGCTAGFSAQDKANNNLYIVTAGHCTDSIGDMFRHAGLNLGTVSKRKYNGGNNDSAVIKVSGSDLSPYIFAAGNHTAVKIISTQSFSQEVIGQQVCISGATTNTIKCGLLTDTSWAGETRKVSTGEVYYFTNMRKASYASEGGDSGAPIFQGNKLVGIHAAAGGTYSHIQYVISGMNINVVTSY
ncbi:S1 family peptidase [Bacillus sp. DJP31]|uniref:S1 family peptidase n=1 Tax=Bacillus sp. DJP31 TaxID=3409789 RepID=UPI003BB78BD4